MANDVYYVQIVKLLNDFAVLYCMANDVYCMTNNVREGCMIPVPVIVLCLSAIFVHNINSSKLHSQSVALRSQYSDHAPEVVTFH